MKHIIELDPDNEPEDRRNLRLMVKAADMSFALWDTMQMLREYYRYKDEELNGDQLAVVEKIQEEFFGILKEYEIQNLVEGNS